PPRRAGASDRDSSDHTSRDEWQAASAACEAFQWDPDHDLHGRVIARPAIQLGLRGSALDAFARHELLEIIDMTDFVAVQRLHLVNPVRPNRGCPWGAPARCLPPIASTVSHEG